MRADASPVFCTVIDAGGPRSIDEAEYRRIIAQAEAFDLFLGSRMPNGGSDARRRGPRRSGRFGA